MSAHRISSFTILPFFIGLLAACGGDSVGISITAAPTDSSATLSATDAGGTGYAIEEASVHLRDIELDIPDGSTCDDLDGELAGGATCSQDKVKIPGPFVIDLIAGTSTPSLSDVRIPASTYKRIDFRVDDGKPDEGVVQAGDPLDDKSFVARAAFDDNGTPTTLVLSLKFNEDVRFDDPAGIDVEAEGEKLLVLLDGSTWLAGVDIAQCINDGDLSVSSGELLVDDNLSGGCSSIEDTIKTNIKLNGQLDKID